jgi:hypothetical protein
VSYILCLIELYTNTEFCCTSMQVGLPYIAVSATVGTSITTFEQLGKQGLSFVSGSDH